MKQSQQAFGEGWDAFCRGESAREACPYAPGSGLAAWFAQGYSEAADGYVDGEADVGEWRDALGIEEVSA